MDGERTQCSSTRDGGSEAWPIAMAQGGLNDGRFQGNTITETPVATETQRRYARCGTFTNDWQRAAGDHKFTLPG